MILTSSWVPQQQLIRKACDGSLSKTGPAQRPGRKRCSQLRASDYDHTETESLSRRHCAALFVALPGLAGLATQAAARPASEVSNLTAAEAEKFTDRDWQQRLTKGQYYVLRKYGTELPLSSPLDHEKRTGVYRCAGCGNEVFRSRAKYDSGTGWPSFYDAIPDAVKLSSDDSIPFFPRTEVACARCNGHLGHVFADGPRPTGQRYCMNGVAMTFSPRDTAAA